MSRRRGSLSVMRDILVRCGSQPIDNNEIRDVERGSGRRYLGLLREYGLLRHSGARDTRGYYHTTQAGRTLLGTIEEVIGILGTNGVLSP